MRKSVRFLATVALVGVCAAGVRADEIKLKDGTKINGTIVGYEENAFRVRTSYGFALVQKDQVVSISVGESEKNPDAEKKPETGKKLDAEKKAEATSEKTPTSAKPSKSESARATTPAAQSAADAGSEGTLAPASAQPPATASKPAAVSTPAALPTAPSAKPATAGAAATTSAATSGSTPAKAAPTAAATVASVKNPPPATAAPAPPPKPPEPEPAPEEVSGNTYTNRAWGFQMYKPPDWQVIEGARSMLPGAITAMGTSDQKTYLLIAEETASKSLTGDMEAIEGRLREVLANYRPVGEKRVTVSGLSAIQHKFRGSIDNHDWSGVVVFIPRDTHLYTIFGMTYADSDLVQIQENIISRAISSLQFTKQ